MKYTSLALLAVLGILPSFAQTPAQTDSETLQAILVEMRSLHNDVRLSQTTQILLTELEVQQNAVNRAMQKRDDAKTRLTQIQDNQKNISAQLTRFADNLNTSTDPQQQKQITQMQDQLKMQMTMLKTQEQDRSNDLQDTESALRREQDTLAGIQDQLNAVVKKLQPVTNP